MVGIRLTPYHSQPLHKQLLAIAEAQVFIPLGQRRLGTLSQHVGISWIESCAFGEQKDKLFEKVAYEVDWLRTPSTFPMHHCQLPRAIAEMGYLWRFPLLR